MEIEQASNTANKVVLRKVQAATLRDQVVASLKEAFFSGLLKPGDTLVERQLAQHMNIGTPAIREALVTLHEQGFVRRVTNTATYVTKFTVEEVRQLYELRIEFELLALKWAKLRITEQNLATLEDHLREMVRVAVLKETRAFYELDLGFHRKCWNFADNKFLTRSLENLVPPLFAFVLNASDATVCEAVARQHGVIIGALRCIDEPAFSNVIRETLTSFALRGISSITSDQEIGGANTRGTPGTMPADVTGKGNLEGI
jgi:DNA-binding GntR family transcriptional regulator